VPIYALIAQTIEDRMQSHQTGFQGFINPAQPAGIVSPTSSEPVSCVLFLEAFAGHQSGNIGIGIGGFDGIGKLLGNILGATLGLLLTGHPAPVFQILITATFAGTHGGAIYSRLKPMAKHSFTPHTATFDQNLSWNIAPKHFNFLHAVSLPLYKLAKSCSCRPVSKSP